MLHVEDVHAGYGSTEILHGVSVRVRRGQFLGLIGPNGSGKSTLLRVASGVLPVGRGRVMLNGHDIRQMARRSLARSLAFLPQTLNLDLPFSVQETVTMGRFPHLPPLGRETALDVRAIAEAMDRTEVRELADRPITELSGGERQRVFIAMCLAQEPEIFLLDEPTTHLDLTHQLAILDLVRDLNRRYGLTVMAVFHDLNLAAEYCDSLLVLHRGSVNAAGSPEEVLTARRIDEVYKTAVRIERNPVSGRPHLVVSAGMNAIGREGTAEGSS